MQTFCELFFTQKVYIMDNTLILNKLQEYKKFKSLADFARFIGIKPQALSNWYSRNTLDVHILSAKFPEIDGNWLLTGEGEMLRANISPMQATDKADRRRIPLYSDVASIGGFNDQVANTDHTATVAEWIDAGDWFPEATAAIRHYGDSMVEYPAGSILVLKRVHDRRLLINGRNYVIETTEFRITKQLQYDGGDYLWAYSSNTDTYPDGRQKHSPIKIPMATIRHIDLVLGCVQKEFSNGAIPIVQS